MSILIIANNKRARFDYEIIDKYEAGIVLTGAEVKSIRSRNVSISESFVIFKKNEAFILNMNVTKYEFSNNKFTITEPTRTRKLLLHKKEINKLILRVKKENLTVVPILLYFSKGKIKLEIALAKGRKNYDKRSLIKERDEKRKLNKMKFN